MIIAFTGAGISKASGIPTFEDQGDLRTKLDRRYATRHKDAYNKIINTLKENTDKAEPNDAHRVLAEYNIPVITMNIDGLHQRAGTEYVVPIHGTLPNIVLYGDPAPLYSKALDIVDLMQKGDILLIIGVSFYTRISTDIRRMAKLRGATVELINSDAETQVREFIEHHKESIEEIEKLLKRDIE